MSKESLRIAIDLDGVVCDFNKGFTDLLNHHEPEVVPEDFIYSSWGWPDSIRPGLEKKGWDLVRKTPDFWLGLQPYREAVDDLKAFLDQKLDVEVYYVTSKVPSAGRPVLEQCNRWLLRHGLLTDQCSVIIKARKTTKAAIYQAMHIAASIDDYDRNVAEAFFLPNHQAFLLDQPWNATFNTLDSVRISKLKDYLEIITEKAK